MSSTIKSIFGLATTLVVLAPGIQSVFAADVIEGTVAEFTSPDDLLLDPATVVIAVDVFGNGDSVVNGVDFHTDRAGLGAAVISETVVDVGGVTVTTTRTGGGDIDNWTAAPAFTGGTPGSAAALGEIMRDIRWSAAPGPTSIDIAGLTPNAKYDVQLLFNEGADRNRFWDIGVEGTLVVDNISSEGDGGVWSPNNSFVYQGEFDSGADGVLNVVMQQDLGGDPPTPTDNNPILQAVIVHSAAPPTAPSDIVLDPNEVLPGAPIGTVVGNLTSVDVNGGTHTYALVAGAGDSANGKFQIVGDQVQVNADLTGDGGQTLSIRVESTDDGALSFAKALNILVLGDSDLDGLQDAWELMFVASLNELNGTKSGPGPGADTGDFDGDGSTDAEEEANGTDPTDDDSDDDGLLDGVETNTGTFVDAGDTGTDPLDDDSDGDGLLDGEEVSGSANTLSNTPTDPTNPDSDGDGIDDGEEVVAGADGFVTDAANPDTDGDGVNDRSDPDPTDASISGGPKIGEVFEFKGPDDPNLHLDSSRVVIAVNVFGGADLDVNGVTFFADGGTPAVGTATNGTVSVTTSRAGGGDIAGWAAAPAFTGSDPTSAANLGEVMRSIRWEAAPNPLTVDIEGLKPGALYEIQLLTNEGADRNRFWDIEVDGVFVADNYSSEGWLDFGHVWAPDNSFGYRGNFPAKGDGTINVVMRQDIGGDPPRPTDNNPILQAVIISPAGQPEDEYKFQVRGSGNDLIFNWIPKQSDIYDILTTTDPEANPDPNTWDVFLADILPTDALPITVPRPADPERYFKLSRKDPPPFVVFDFEDGVQGWTFGAGTNPPDAGTTVWERGMPTNPTGPPTGADASANCLATNLAANYEIGANIWARSPIIDLTGITGARLRFQQFRGLEDGFDYGIVRVFQASDSTQLGPGPFTHPILPITGIYGTTGIGTDWETTSVDLSPEMVDKEIYLEFLMISDEFENDAGWHIDNVAIELAD